MAVHMKRSESAGLQTADSVSTENAQVAYKDGVLVWVGPDGHTKGSSEPLKGDEIVFVLKHKTGGYLIYSLSEPSGDTSGPTPKLSKVFARDLPQELLEARLIAKRPDHLLGDAQHPIHVIVSTKSGLCRAQNFYDDVLRPLLSALGLSERSIPGETSAGPGYHVLITQSSHSIRDFARDLAGGGAQGNSASTTQKGTVVLLSGDGGVVDLLNGVPEGAAEDQRPAISLLPLGTGNALFHSLHKTHYQAAAQRASQDGKSNDGNASNPSSEYVLGLRTLFSGRPAPLPSFRAEFSPGARLVLAGGEAGDKFDDAPTGTEEPRPPPRSDEDGPSTLLGPPVSHLRGGIVASYGFHASLVWESDTPEYRVHGAKRFGMAAAELLKRSHAYDCAVEVRRTGSAADGPWARLGGGEGPPFSYVLATLVSNLEKTFTISPASRPLDGQLRLVSFGDVGGDKTMEIMMAAYQEGKHVGMAWKTEGTGKGKGGEERKVGYDEVDEVRITVREHEARWRKVCVDGTIVELERDGWVVVKREPRARLNVLVDRVVLP